ncbi:plant/protein, putative (DUF3411) [Wolffia australiana]
MASQASFQTSFNAIAAYHHRHCPQPCGVASFPFDLPFSGRLRPTISRRLIAASAAPPPSDMVGADDRRALERCFNAGSTPSSSLSSLPSMKGNFGAFGAVTLEKSKLDLSQKTTRTSPEISTGGGGGDIGKRNSHGGGDGGDDGGDDDDYFGDFDEFDEGDDGGLFRRRLILQELFDRKFVDAVLEEWYKTMVNLPAGLLQAYEMGLVSSAQMVRFLSINARPTITRFISRALPDSLSRAFIGRMIADPSFLYKLCLEQVATISYSVWWELKNRKGRIKEEWDLALVNVLTVSACNALVVWSLAPCHSYANTFQFEWQNFLNKLPNNVFEKSYLLREFDLQKRVQSFFYKAAGLSLVGLAAGMAQGAVSNYSAGKKEGRLSVTVPSVNTNALGYGAFLGIYANLRYQLVNGLDRAVFHRFDVLGVALFFSTAVRILNVQVGETSRRAWLGVEADPLTQSDNLLKAYNRPAAAAADGAGQVAGSNWFISKNAIVSGLGLLGIGQGAPADAEAPKARRKRVVKKKLSPAAS